MRFIASNRNKLTIAILALTLIMIGGAIVATLIYRSRNKSNDDSDSSSTISSVDISKTAKLTQTIPPEDRANYSYSDKVITINRLEYNINDNVDAYENGTRIDFARVEELLKKETDIVDITYTISEKTVVFITFGDLPNFDANSTSN